jgi:hypothetical protein
MAARHATGEKVIRWQDALVVLMEERDISMGSGWKMTIREDVDKYGKRFIEIAKVRKDRKIGRFKLNPRYCKKLGEELIAVGEELEKEGDMGEDSGESEE